MWIVESYRTLASRMLRRGVLLALLLAPCTALALQYGTYRCWSYNVSGGAGNCRLAPPIIIEADGTYRESSTTGTYRVTGEGIHFSASSIRGPARLSAKNQITFEYDYRGWRHTVTYLCQDCTEAGATAPGSTQADGPPSRGTLVWADLRLQFDRTDSYLTSVNTADLVPAEKAAQFAASGARVPPAGSATGSAFRDGRQSMVVVANFRRVPGGRRYVVFLNSGFQRVPVAEVFIPASPVEQTIELNARFNFSPSGALPAGSIQQREALIGARAPDVPPTFGAGKRDAEHSSMPAEAGTLAQSSVPYPPGPPPPQPPASLPTNPPPSSSSSSRGLERVLDLLRVFTDTMAPASSPSPAPGMGSGPPPPYPSESPPYPSASPPYPSESPPYPSESPPYPSASPPYPTASPPTNPPPSSGAQPGLPVPGYGPPSGGRPAGPGQKCHPLIPTYSQPGCIE